MEGMYESEIDLESTLNHESNEPPSGSSLNDGDDASYHGSMESRSSLSSSFFIEHPYSLKNTVAADLAVVFEELVDQLVTLGRNNPAPQLDLRSGSSVMLDKRHRRPKFNDGIAFKDDQTSNRMILKQTYQTILSRRIAQLGGDPAPRITVNHAAKQAQLSRKNEYGKLQIERAELQVIANKVTGELIQHSSFSSLVHAINHEKRKKMAALQKIHSYCFNKVYIQNLKKDIKATRRNKILELKRLRDEMWEIEDDFQELMFRCNMETEYTIKTGEAKCKHSKKINGNNYREKELELDDLRLALSCEAEVHTSMCTIIEQKRAEVSEKLDRWLEKYERDRDKLLNELDQLKEERNKCLDRMDWLDQTTKLYTPIVMDERRVKKIEADRRRTKAIQAKRATRIQAWWRGTLVRKCMGPFKDLMKFLEEQRQAKKVQDKKKAAKKAKNTEVGW